MHKILTYFWGKSGKTIAEKAQQQQIVKYIMMSKQLLSEQYCNIISEQFVKLVMEPSIEQKQTFLRTQILEGGLDPEAFMAFMGVVKDEGQNINLQNWTIDEVKDIVATFKNSIEEEIKREKQKMKKPENHEKITREIVSSILVEENQQKRKVYYEYKDLWDYQFNRSQKCQKSDKYFEIKDSAAIQYKSWDIKKTGGYLFGLLGTSYELEITFITNFTHNTITRKNQDIDWLREKLSKKYPGSYLPPLSPLKNIQPEDKQGLMKRVKQSILFLNSLLHFDYLVQNKYFYTFITEKDPKIFSSFKAKQNAIISTCSVAEIQTENGKFDVQISQRLSNFVKDSSNYASSAHELYKNMEKNIKKVLADLETLSKHLFYIANDFNRLHEKHQIMVEKCQIKGFGCEYEQLSGMLLYFNNTFQSLSDSHNKNITLLRQFSDEFVQYKAMQCMEFMTQSKKYEKHLDKYLNFKHQLRMKKQSNFPNVSNWGLEEKSMIKKEDAAKLQQEDAFTLMFPSDTRIEEEMKIWQAYTNRLYEQSYRSMLKSQEKSFIDYGGQYCFQMEKIMEGQTQAYRKFQQMFSCK